jgi:ferritin-like metal-binding protein YciE
VSARRCWSAATTFLDEFAEALEDGPGSAGRATFYTGARGAGKTVMLNAVEVAHGLQRSSGAIANCLARLKTTNRSGRSATNLAGTSSARDGQQAGGPSPRPMSEGVGSADARELHVRAKRTLGTRTRQLTKEEAVADLPEGKTKLIQYLDEAYGLERRLETALQAHLQLATRTTYKQRLRAHLTETKRHSRDVQRRIKQLGGTPETVDLPGPDAVSGIAQAAVAGAQRAAALVQGPLHALRGTGEEEKQLKNAKTEYASEAEEIATYSAVIALAETLGDTDTVRVARAILREEERMSSFLSKEIPRMVKAIAKAEIPASQRPTRRRRASS